MRLIALILSFFVFINLNAATYFVATNGNDANPGTIGSPWKTLQRISAQTLNPGDIVYIRAGTYMSGTPDGSPKYSWFISGKNGTVGNPILISAYPPDFPTGGRIVFDCSDFAHPTGWTDIRIGSCSNLIVRGIRTTGNPQRQAGGVHIGFWVITNPGGNITLDNCEADHIGNTGFRLDDTNNASFLNCDAHHIDNPFDPGVQRHGGSDGFGRYDPSNTSTNTLYRGCRGYWCSDDSWDCFGSPGTITYDSCWAFWSGYVQDVFPLTHTQAGIDWGDGNGIKLGSNTTPASPNVTMRFVTRCFAFENYQNGFDQNVTPVRMEFYNNTSFNNNKAGWFIYDATPMIAKNNIAYANVSFQQNFQAGSTTQSNNSWNGAVTVTNADFLSVTDVAGSAGVAGARQANGTLPNITYMHIAPGSDLINAGVNVGLPFTPPAPDLGPFPHVAGSNVPPVANAGLDQTITLPPPSTVLDGSGSSTSVGTITGYAWIQTGGAISTIVTPNAAMTTINGLTQGQYTYRLTVTNSFNLTATDDVTITVNNPTVTKYYGRKL